MIIIVLSTVLLFIPVVIYKVNYNTDSEPSDCDKDYTDCDFNTTGKICNQVTQKCDAWKIVNGDIDRMRFSQISASHLLFLIIDWSPCKCVGKWLHNSS